MTSGPLAGVRVIDLASVVMGPYAAQLLGDMGADVIKVESPAGDLTRVTRPQRAPGMGALALNVNRNKRGIVLDLKTPVSRSGSPRHRRVCVHIVRRSANTPAKFWRKLTR